MLLIPNALCCSLYKRNCVCAVTKFFTRKNQLPTSAGKAQAQLHFRDDQQRAFGISNISSCYKCMIEIFMVTFIPFLGWVTIIEKNKFYTKQIQNFAWHDCACNIRKGTMLLRRTGFAIGWTWSNHWCIAFWGLVLVPSCGYALAAFRFPCFVWNLTCEIIVC